MNKKNENNIGCGKALLYVCAGILALVIIGGAIEGIGNMFAKIPWYGNLILSIGFVFLMFKLFKN